MGVRLQTSQCCYLENRVLEGAGIINDLYSFWNFLDLILILHRLIMHLLPTASVNRGVLNLSKFCLNCFLTCLIFVLFFLRDVNLGHALIF